MYDLMSQIFWTNIFLDDQGYRSKDIIVYQDNQSDILLDKNWEESSSKRTKHTNVPYFFMRNIIEKVTLEWNLINR